MSWTAVIPLKPVAERKQRLAVRLSFAAREKLSRQMFGHVANVLGGAPEISSVHLLSRTRADDWDGGWILDRGRGLNVELDAARLALDVGALLIMHADLPLLSVDDVQHLLAGAREAGIAIAPDRHSMGTNAIAIADRRRFAFQFGADSFRLHSAQAEPHGKIIARTGLGLDIDTSDDLDAALAQGFVLA